MHQPLFRQDAVDHQGERLWGDLIVSQPVSYTLITLFLSLLALIAIAFLILNDYARKQAVSGVLTPDKGTVGVSAGDGGLLLEIRVKQGDVVGKGEELFQLQSDRTFSQGETVSAQLLNEISRQKAGLREAVQAEQRRAQLESQGLSARAEGLERQIAQLERLRVNEEELERVRSREYARAGELMKRELIAASSLESIYGELLQQRNVLRQVELELDRAELEQDELQRELRILRLGSQERIRGIEAEIIELEKQEVQLQAEQLNLAIAPIAGTVTAISSKVGQTSAPQQSIVSLLPLDSVLQAELLVPSRAIGFIEEGQQVIIRYDAFPYQKFGTQEALVKEISQTIMLPSEQGNAVRLNEPVYRVVAELASQTVRAYGKDLSLKPGMLLSADVVLDQRSLMEWLLEPLYSLTGG